MVVGCLVWNASEVLMGVATGGVPVRLRFLVLETGLNIRDVLGGGAEDHRSKEIRLCRYDLLSLLEMRAREGSTHS